MPSYNFKTWKAAKVKSGESRQTIRPVRSRPTVPGDILYLYHGQRTKSCELLRTETCKSVEPVHFARSSLITFIFVGGRLLPWSEVEDLAKADGFENSTPFIDFFVQHYGIPNSRPLELIKW
ncbi:MAG: hypothetical protein WC359_13060 [Dehalococcoidia bacterium]